MKALRESILEDRSKENILRWANRFISKELDLSEHVALLEDSDKNISFRFLWLMEHVALKSPELVEPHLPYLYSLRDKLSYPGYKRGFSKLVAVCGFPAEIEGEVLDLLFQWMQNHTSDIAVKVFAMQAICNLCETYPEIAGELIDVIESQYELNSPAYKARARRLLPKLEKLKNPR